MATFCRASVALAVSLSLADAFAPGFGPAPMLRRARATAAAPVKMAGGAALPNGGAAPFGTQVRTFLPHCEIFSARDDVGWSLLAVLVVIHAVGCGNLYHPGGR